MDQSEYDEYVRTVAKNSYDEIRNGQSVERTAQVCVRSIEQVGDATAITTVAEPYHDHRIWPKEIINNTNTEYPINEEIESLRQYAVKVLRRDIEHVIAEEEQAREMWE